LSAQISPLNNQPALDFLFTCWYTVDQQLKPLIRLLNKRSNRCVSQTLQK